MTPHRFRDDWVDLDRLCAQKLTLEQMRRGFTDETPAAVKEATEMLLLTLQAKIDELRSRLERRESA
jgi:hypothetical protein